MEYLYTITPNSDEPIMVIDRHIGYDKDDGYGIMGDAFSREMVALAEMQPKRIQVWINSVGGSVMDAYSIIGTISKIQVAVDTYNLGMAASSALNIFLMGRKRYMMDYAQIMTHNVSGADSTSEEWNNSIAQIIAGRTGKKKEEIRTLMQATTYMNAQKALESGFCDEIESSGVEVSVSNEMDASEMMKKFAPRLREVMNKANESSKLNSNHTVKMKQVANKLGLLEDANEESILAAVNKLEQRATSAEQELETAKNSLQAKDDELKQVNNKLAEVELKAKEESERANKAAAKELIEKAQNEGRLPKGESDEVKKVVNKWLGLAESDLEGTKEMIESLPLNKKSNTIELPANGATNPSYSMAGMMAEINNKNK